MDTANKEIQVAHRSFSSFSSWVRCGKAWELERKLQAPSEPAWWFVGGSAFHSAAEMFLLKEVEKMNEPSVVFSAEPIVKALFINDASDDTGNDYEDPHSI